MFNNLPKEISMFGIEVTGKKIGLLMLTAIVAVVLFLFLGWMSVVGCRYLASWTWHGWCLVQIDEDSPDLTDIRLVVSVIYGSVATWLILRHTWSLYQQLIIAALFTVVPIVVVAILGAYCSFVPCVLPRNQVLWNVQLIVGIVGLICAVAVWNWQRLKSKGKNADLEQILGGIFVLIVAMLVLSSTLWLTGPYVGPLYWDFHVHLLAKLCRQS